MKSDFQLILSRVRTYSENPLYFRTLVEEVRPFDRELAAKLDKVATCLSEVNEHVRRKLER